MKREIMKSSCDLQWLSIRKLLPTGKEQGPTSGEEMVFLGASLIFGGNRALVTIDHQFHLDRKSQAELKIFTWLRWSLIQVTRNWPERQWTWRIPLVKRSVNLRRLPEGRWIWEWHRTKKCVFSLRRMMANEWGDRTGANLGIHNVQGGFFFPRC